MKPRNRYRLLLWLASLSGLVNLVYAVWIVRHAITRQVVNVSYSEPAPVDMVAVSNLLEALSRPLPAVSVSDVGSETRSFEDQKNPVEISTHFLPYGYSVVQGRKYARIYEEYYTEGDMMSYGRISSIFPDRIYLDTGDVVINRNRMIERGSLNVE